MAHPAVVNVLLAEGLQVLHQPMSHGSDLHAVQREGTTTASLDPPSSLEAHTSFTTCTDKCDLILAV